MFLNRNITESIEKALLRSPVVLLTGPRQSGKTFLMKEIAKTKSYSYVTFDDIQTLTFAKNDPVGFISDLKKPVILDEVQRFPELFLTIKKDVDENRVPGRYALTGSANPLLIPKLGDSLAGRMEIFYLYPFSQGEILNKKEVFIDHVFSKKINDLKPEKINKDDLFKRILKGGFPTVQEFDINGKYAWFSSYVTNLIERDVKDLSNITDLIDFPKLLNILAARTSGLVNFADLSRESSLVSTTMRRYLSLLQTLYITQFSLPWFSNIGLRFVKAPKLYFSDTGLLSYLLDLTSEKISLEPNLGGKIFENFVFTEIFKQSTWNKTRASIYHFREHSGNEVDIILENPQGEIVGIEVKNTQTVKPEDFKSLKLLQEKMEKRFISGLVLYHGENIIPVGNSLFAVPVSALWS
ncbi:MAG: ATP-binding protein [Candidatus Babeliales bacterium]